MSRLHHRLLRPPVGPMPLLGRLAIAGQLVAALAFIVFLLHAEGVRLPFHDDGSWKLTAAFADAGGLREGAHVPVLVSGVPSGRVESVTLRDGRAVATLRLDRAARGVVRTDAQAVIEPRSALEDLTVDLRPGSPSAPAARDGTRIGVARTVPTVPLDRVVSVMDADTRAQVAVVLDQVAVALRDRPGALRRAVDELRPVVDSGGRVASALSRRRALLSRLVGAVDRLASAAGTHASALSRALHAGRRTLDVTAARERDLRAVVRALPGTLSDLDTALRRTQALAAPLTPALTGLRPAARALPGALASLQRTTPAARALVSDLDALARDGATPVRHLRSAARRLGATATQLRTPVTQLQGIVKAVDDRKQGVGELGENFSGILSTNDANGPILRGLGFFEPFNPANLGFPAGAKGAMLARAKAESVAALVDVCRRDNPIACLVRYLVPGLPR